ncbi:MAG: RdgB/HAM1 family non-canonical purine NTP pyrophosphatase [Clostridiales bacterium]|nr:RdgB/HAM1 family non-canonical purine NTP pyrophosphatase [Clostridiales bacterium]
MTFIMASNNEDKLKEMRAILSELGFSAVSQGEAGISLDIEETGETFYSNACLKAEAAMKASGLPAVADDSGLMVDVLNGEPGVRSKRYGGEGLTDGDRNMLLLRHMEFKEHRTAKFVSSIVCVFPNGDIVAAEGDCEGVILREPKGKGGFGYDPVFFVTGTGKSMAELTPQEKNRVSHRGKALRAFEPKLRDYLKKAGQASC